MSDSEIGQRLKDEVERIGGPGVAAKVLGVARSTLYKWFGSGGIEADHLRKLYDHGVDATYVIFGVRGRPKAITLADQAEEIEEGLSGKPRPEPDFGRDLALAQRNETARKEAPVIPEADAAPLRAPDRKMIEQIMASVLRKFQSRGLAPPPDLFAKLVLMCYDLVVEGEDESADSAVEKLAGMFK